MHRSSESVAALAGALAKAQGELVNPEKSLVASVQTDRAGEIRRSFRYAPLSAGLDIVRKTLGRHEIATMQTTATDAATGTVNLTTILAHASGEWISSDWPVCPVADIAMPRRMGAALTYARRYALFTLVGIAGDDDTDAPDLEDGAETPPNGAAAATEIHPVKASDANPASDSTPAPVMQKTAQRRPFPKVQRQNILNSEQSALLRDRMLGEMPALGSAAEAATWAQNALTLKNTLKQSDAQLIEQAFASRLIELNAGDIVDSPQLDAAPPLKMPISKAKPRSEPIDKSKLRFGEPRRLRNKAHLRFVASLSCLVCGRQPSDAHHLKFAQPRALGRKVSDEFTVPLCRTHHRELHRASNEPAWWTGVHIDPLKIARALWTETRNGTLPTGGLVTAEANSNATP